MFNIALFGVGRIGQVHAVNIASHPETCVYSVIDPYVEGAQKLATKYNAVIQTVDEALTDPNVHAVCICSATDTHANLIELAAQHGKVIFCEKPIDLDLSRVRDCLAAVNKYQVPMVVGFNRRFDPQFRAVKDQLNAGVVGQAESLMIISRDPTPPPAEYSKVSGGMFRDMTIHDLDMARFIIGENPVSITAQGSCMVDPAIGEAGDIDTSVLVMNFPSGAMATIHNSRRSGYGYDQRIELHGSKGLLKASNMKENLVEHWGETGCVAAKPQHFFLERYQAAYVAEWQHFVDVLNGQTPNCTGADGEYALMLADAAIESMKTGKTVML
ncbi:inositol 2-dehydrogenase [Photobacterium aphoticum]|uniref:Inositol 2-dehydrogenase n=1 Tax=Photobacterium aphoticum TaxID=754436 RepID=A0A0J1GQ54_9GAMM|nr:inositol 2-dehydrogenase [Photobacterium aphoticum]KLV01893.1 inositol 2-dehydrogenase [Photobacterium aphoticum]PSU60125.1 inositol 2-dehydrogenase [Photobacterium aphoticum]GHA33337.1 inositol 2-dehydrogenase [Photobacterium aphoticum]